MISRAFWRWGLLVAVGVVMLGGIGYVLAVALGGATFYETTLPATPGHLLVTTHNPEPWLIAAAAAACLGLLLWANAERRLGASAAQHAAAAERAQHELQAALDQLERDREREQTGWRDASEAWRRERAWNRKLREQIAGMQHQGGVLGSGEDVREMVLELTRSLVDAEKAILFSARQHGDGGLELVCSVGFASDPGDSALAQRFATEVIERDTTIRQDDAGELADGTRTAADEEVRNLLAIPMYLLDDFAGVIVCANRDGGFDELDDEVLLAVGNQASAVLQNSRLHGDLRTAYLSTIRVLANAIELKDPELRGHSDGVSEYVLAVADRLKFSAERRESLIFASLLHDVGKIGISERILLKPASLTAEERTVMQLHPRIGYRLLRQVTALETIAPAVLHHHERFDGTGYPGRLRGEDIPLEARIIAVADAYSAMTTNRPYSRARSVADACSELERCAGAQFDPQVVKLFLEQVRRQPAARHGLAAAAADPEIAAHRVNGDFVLGAQAFAITDSLTLLYSHRHLHETAGARARQAAAGGGRFGVIVVELTDLQVINLHHGFAAGDAALQSAAAVVQRVAVRHDGLAFRASGHMLALLAPVLGPAAADTIRTELLEELPPDLPVRVGVAVWRGGDDGEHVIARAIPPVHAVAPPLLPAAPVPERLRLLGRFTQLRSRL